MGKIYTAKTPPGDFKVTTPKNPLLSQQAVTSKGIPVPYTNLQLNHYPNTQLDLFCSDNLSFSMHGSQYVTNQLCGSQYATLITNQRRMLAVKFFNSSPMKIKKLLGHKTYGVQTQQLLHKKDELGQILSSVTICLNRTLLNTSATCVTFYGP